VLTAERPSIAPGERRRGCRLAVQLTRRRRSHPKHREAGAEAPAKPAGAYQASRARSTGRDSESMATNGGDGDESPPSDGSTRRGRVIAPSGGDGARQSSPKSDEGVIGNSRSPEGIRVRARPSEGESEGAASWAELVRSSPLGLT
jgi:hypothetical protein